MLYQSFLAVCFSLITNAHATDNLQEEPLIPTTNKQSTQSQLSDLIPSDLVTPPSSAAPQPWYLQIKNFIQVDDEEEDEEIQKIDSILFAIASTGGACIVS